MTHGHEAYTVAAMVAAKNRTTAALLCFFLGGLGAHRFYTGKQRTAVGQAALVVGGFILGGSIGGSTGGQIATLSVLGGSIWVVVDFITILLGRFTDATGTRLDKRPSSRPDPAADHPEDARRVEQRILLAAKSLGGLVSPTELSLRTGLSIDEAKGQLEGLVERGHAQLQIRKNGSLAYTFPDLLSDERRGELEEF